MNQVTMVMLRSCPYGNSHGKYADEKENEATQDILSSFLECRASGVSMIDKKKELDFIHG